MVWATTLDSENRPTEAVSTKQDWLPTERRYVGLRVLDSAGTISSSTPEEALGKAQAIQRLTRVARDVLFDATALPFDCFVVTPTHDGFRCSVRMIVPDRNSPSVIVWIQVWRDYVLPWEALPTDPEEQVWRVLQTLRFVACGCLEHEFDENLRVRGALLVDQHRAPDALLARSTR